jgi:hypothetical protein
MSGSEVLPDEALDAIASKIGVRLAGAMSAFPPGSVPIGWAKTAKAVREAADFGGEQPTMGDTFPVYALDASELLRATDDLRALARPTGRWHHQIKYSGRARAYARSTRLGGARWTWSIREVMESDLAEKIDVSCKWLRENLAADYTARLLTLPSYHVDAFWLIHDETEDQKIVIIDSPSYMNSLVTDLIYSSREFIQSLRSERTVVGLIPP